MSAFFLGCVLGFLFVGCVMMPFVAPWRLRVRYLVAAQVADPVFGVGPPVDVSLREVRVVSVRTEAGHVELVVDEAGAAPVARRRVLARASCAPGELAQLDGWSAAGTPLLMVVDEHCDTHLYGPDGAVTYLTRAEERTK